MLKQYLLVLCLGLVACSDTDVKQIGRAHV